MLARRIFLAGIAAGLTAGVFVTAIQAVKIAPLIAAAEVYERSAAHQPESVADEHFGHQHPPARLGAETPAPSGAPAPAQSAEWEPDDGFERLAYTLVANILVGVAYGLFLSAGIALRSAHSGARSSAMTGVAWGIAGFAIFQLAPSFGLPPELPGSAAAALLARQSWWLGTALATAVGLALVAFPRNRAWRLLGIAAIAAPHLIGAPQAPPGGTLPAELAAEFVAASLGTAALFGLVLGGGVGWLYSRLGRTG
jgi:cobalt transporter subunit CbtA